TEAYKHFPDSCLVNLSLGQMSEDAKRNNEAISYYEKAKQVSPNSQAANYKLGLIYGQAGDFAKAEKNFEVLKNAPDPDIRAIAYFNLGIIYEKQGDLARAISSYQSGLELNPTSKNAL